ncbi:hypothetical protein HK097_009090, partial [Rhizophlyctis rosea]
MIISAPAEQHPSHPQAMNSGRSSPPPQSHSTPIHKTGHVTPHSQVTPSSARSEWIDNWRASVKQEASTGEEYGRYEPKLSQRKNSVSSSSASSHSCSTCRGSSPSTTSSESGEDGEGSTTSSDDEQPDDSKAFQSPRPDIYGASVASTPKGPTPSRQRNRSAVLLTSAIVSPHPELKGVTQNVRTIHTMCRDNGLLNPETNDPFPVTPTVLAGYIKLQTARMLRGEIVFSSLNWYVHSLRKMHLDNGWDWATVRNDPLVTDVWEKARHLGDEVSASKKKDDPPVEGETPKPKKKRGKPYTLPEEIRAAKKGRLDDADGNVTLSAVKSKAALPAIAPKPSILSTPATTPGGSPPGGTYLGRSEENSVVLPSIASAGLRLEGWDNQQRQQYRLQLPVPPQPAATPGDPTPTSVPHNLTINLQPPFAHISGAPSQQRRVAPTPRSARANFQQLDEIVNVSLRNIQEYRNSRNCHPARRQRIDALLSFIHRPVVADQQPQRVETRTLQPIVLPKTTIQQTPNGGPSTIQLPSLTTSIAAFANTRPTERLILPRPEIPQQSHPTTIETDLRPILPLPLPHDSNSIFTAETNQQIRTSPQITSPNPPPHRPLPSVHTILSPNPTPAIFIPTTTAAAAIPSMTPRIKIKPLSPPPQVTLPPPPQAKSASPAPQQQSSTTSSTSSTLPPADIFPTPCSMCRTRKIKCDRVRPESGPCVRGSAKRGTNLACSWEVRKNGAGGKVEVPVEEVEEAE